MGLGSFEALRAAYVVARGAEVNGVFLSCTNLRTLDIIRLLETDLGFPVLTSNQVSFRHMAICAGITLSSDGPERLPAAA